MTPPTLLTLPAEIRQLIVAETVVVRLHQSKSLARTPLADVCQCLREDVRVVMDLRLWHPDPKTGSLVPIETHHDMYHLPTIEQWYREGLSRRRSPWEGIQEVQIRLFDETEIVNHGSTIFFQDLGSPTPTSLYKLTRNFYYAMRNIIFSIEWLQSLARYLPHTVKRLKFDLMLPPKIEMILQMISPGGAYEPAQYNCANKYKLQGEFWQRALMRLQAMATQMSERMMRDGLANAFGVDENGAADRTMGTDFLALEIVGELPHSQIHAVAQLPKIAWNGGRLVTSMECGLTRNFLRRAKEEHDAIQTNHTSQMEV